MGQVVAYLCGIWFWLTRRWRIDVYCAAAETLELAHGYLVRDFAAHASNRDRGNLSPQQSEALALLERHAIQTYDNAKRLAKFTDCCRYVVAEMRELNRPAVSAASRPTPAVVMRPATLAIRVRFAANRVLRFTVPRPSWISWISRPSWLQRPFWIPSVAWVIGYGRLLTLETWGFVAARWPKRDWRFRPVADPALPTKPSERPLKAA